MKAYLFIDFGSTFTKLTLIDIEKEEIIATAKSYTTVETDVANGYHNAYKDLMSKVDGELDIVKKLACSSAAGGLKIAAIGLVPDLTAEAAKRAALGAGARVIKTYSYKMNNHEIEELRDSNADMILLAGGTDGGNTEVILHNAQLIADFGITKPVVVAGNKSSYDDIEKVFKDKIEYRLTENVMPKLNEINVNPARETIRDIFMERITKAKGMTHIEDDISGILMPTPQAVLKAAEALSLGTPDEDGVGDLVVVDIGGATTDIHSIADGAPSKPGVIYRGLEEPISKRTVEGDLGMRYSAESIYEAAGLRMIKKYLDISDYDVEEEFKRRYDHTDLVFTDEKEIKFDEMMAKICVDISMKRHCGYVEAVYSPLGTMYQQIGKDLTELNLMIGTGGILVNSEHPQEILKAGLYDNEDLNSLKPRYPEFSVDKNYILSAMGLLTMVDKNMAVRMMKKYIVI